VIDLDFHKIIELIKQIIIRAIKFPFEFLIAHPTLKLILVIILILAIILITIMLIKNRNEWKGVYTT